MRDDVSAYDPPSLREHRRENRPHRPTGVLVGAILALAVAVVTIVSMTAANHWQALGR